MSKHKSITLLAAIAALGVASPLAAQTKSTVNASTLTAAVTARAERSNRAAVTSALTSGRALEIAATMGLSADAVSSRLGALDEAATARIADEVLAGGDSTIVISTTAIIIGLLLLILLTR